MTTERLRRTFWFCSHRKTEVMRASSSSSKSEKPRKLVDEPCTAASILIVLETDTSPANSSLALRPLRPASSMRLVDAGAAAINELCHWLQALELALSTGPMLSIRHQLSRNAMLNYRAYPLMTPFSPVPS